MTDNAVRRLTQRGGLTKVHPSIYRYALHTAKQILSSVTRVAVALAFHERLKTVSSEHFIKGFCLNRARLFGYADKTSSSTHPSVVAAPAN